jgi:glycosyltransferase involved in cell wall biosynthesis
VNRTEVKRLPISVCLIAGAEAGRIGRTLQSVADWTSEVIVVLNEDVTDGTEQIAQQHGAKVFREPWKGFRDQKNSAAQKAVADWILGLDADEVVSPELREEIQQLFADHSKLKSFAAFSFPRLSWFCGRWIRHGDWYPDRSTRLWRRGQAEWGGGSLHEKLHVQGKTGQLHADLLHYSGEGIHDRLRKLLRFSEEFVREHSGEKSAPGFFALALRPFWRFVRAYFFRLGFLDGWPGYYIASHMAFATLVRYAKLREAAALRDAPKPQ